MNVTAVLVNYKRPDDLAKVMEDLKRYEFIKEIMVWDNTKQNVGVYGRYLMMKKASNETIYTQDDDCIIDGIPDLYEAYDGTCLVNGMKENRMKDYAGLESLVGWGAFLQKSWIGVIDEYIKLYGEDQVLYETADRIFTTLLEKPRKTIPVKVHDFPSAMAPHAMSLQSGYMSNINTARTRVLRMVETKVPAW